CVTMWLKDHVNLLESTLSRGSQGGADFSGMMAVIVHDTHSIDLAFELEAAVHASKLRKGFGDFFCRDVQSHAGCNRGRGVQHIVVAGHVEIELSNLLPAVHYFESAARLPIFGATAFVQHTSAKRGRF